MNRHDFLPGLGQLLASPLLAARSPVPAAEHRAAAFCRRRSFLCQRGRRLRRAFRSGGKLRDPYELFAERGANLVRLRLWNEPTWTNYSTEADVTRSIERAKKAGMHVLLDFHYSDDWADPQKQTIPAAWANGHRRRRQARHACIRIHARTCWRG